MADELNQKESPPETLPGEPNPPEGAELKPSAVSEARVTELESLLAQKDEALAKAKVRFVELEQAVAGRDSELVTLKQTKADLEARLATISHSLAEAVASYKATVVQANPGVIEELITGDSIESINESLSKAKVLVNKVMQGVEAQISWAKVPAGAPERTSPDLSVLSPREKIQYAIGKK